MTERRPTGRAAVKDASCWVRCSQLTACHKDICRRAMCAETAFNGHSHFWSAEGSTRKQRSQLLEKVCTSVLSHGAGSWNVSVADQHMLRAVQLRCHSKVISFARNHGEDDESYFHRRNSCIRDVRVSVNAPTWDALVLGRLHAWAGHLARIRVYDPQRLTLRVLDWRSVLELESLQFLTGSQGHGKRFHVWRWEAQFHKFYLDQGITWQDAAKGCKWTESKSKWVEHRQHPQAGRQENSD